MGDDFACKTIDPRNPSGPPADAILPGDLTTRYYKYSPVRYMNLIAAKHVLENPLVIFHGVREYNEGGWCYAGRPDEWYIKPSRTAPFPSELVFAVYLNPNMRVYECRAERVAEHGSPFPIDWETGTEA